MVTIYKGDDTNAFGNNLIQINLDGADGLTISKVIFQCGTLQKTYVRPKFPIFIDFSSDETKRLDEDSVCYLQVFDEKGRRQTCETTLSFKAKSYN